MASARARIGHDVFVGTLGIDVVSIAHIIAWRCHQNGNELHALHLGRSISGKISHETHIEIPFVLNLKGLHAAQSRDDLGNEVNSGSQIGLHENRCS